MLLRYDMECDSTQCGMHIRNAQVLDDVADNQMVGMVTMCTTKSTCVVGTVHIAERVSYLELYHESTTRIDGSRVPSPCQSLGVVFVGCQSLYCPSDFRQYWWRARREQLAGR